MRNIRLLGGPVLALVLAGGAAGCGPVLNNLPAIISAVSDAALILDQIEGFTNMYFVMRPDVPKQDKVTSAIAKCRSALIVAQRGAVGAEAAKNGDTAGAFTEFEAAYAELVVLIQHMPGVTIAGPGQKLSAVQGELVIPQPLALSLKGETPQ